MIHVLVCVQVYKHDAGTGLYTGVYKHDAGTGLCTGVQA